MIKLTKKLNGKQFIEMLTATEQLIAEQPGATTGDDCCPVVHKFGDGLYIRQMTAPAGMVNVSKLHKTTHPFFILTGSFTVATPDGPVKYIAPAWGITKAGTKRGVYFHEDTTWITVHATEETDLGKIEDEVIARTYDELPDKVKEQLCLS